MTFRETQNKHGFGRTLFAVKRKGKKGRNYFHLSKLWAFLCFFSCQSERIFGFFFSARSRQFLLVSRSTFRSPMFRHASEINAFARENDVDVVFDRSVGRELNDDFRRPRFPPTTRRSFDVRSALLTSPASTGPPGGSNEGDDRAGGFTHSTHSTESDGEERERKKERSTTKN